MYDPKDIVAIERAGMRTGAALVVAAEVALVGLIFVDTKKVRGILANALDSRWTPFNRKNRNHIYDVGVA